LPGWPCVQACYMRFFATLWMVFWGMSVRNLAHEGEMIPRIDAYKGWALVVVTAFVLYGILRRQMRRLEKDVEGRTQAEQLMRESQACFVTIFQSSPMGITLSRLEDGAASADHDARYHRPEEGRGSVQRIGRLLPP
jgi:hypothetical protein